MYSAMLIATGAALLIYSIYLCRKITPLIEWPYLRKPWRLLSSVMIIAFIGYVLYLWCWTPYTYIKEDLLLSSILFFWAVFAMIAVRAGYSLVDGLKTIRVDINLSRHALESDHDSVERMKGELEIKNEELEKILAELYALRNAMEKNKSGKSMVENRRMAKILTELRKELEKNKEIA